MAKKILLVLICLVSLVIFVSTLHAQSPKKTITLPNGDVIHDLNGEWDALVENYGPWVNFGSYPQIMKITQTGSSFVGIRMMNDPNNRKGSKSIQGELDKNGFKELQMMTGLGPIEADGKISEDGNKMVLDNGDKVRLTLTRK